MRSLRALKRIPGYGVAADYARRLRYPAARKTARILRGDIDACETALRRISSQIPSGDPRRPVWMICSMQTVLGLKLEGVMAMAVRHCGVDPVAVYADTNPWPQRYHRLFGIRRSVPFYQYLDQTAPESVKELEPRGSTFSSSELVDLTYRGVDVGRIALSNLLYRRKFSRIDLQNPATTAELRGELREVARRVRAAERMLLEHRPSLAMVLEKGLSPSAEIFGVCIAAGIDVVQYSGSQNLNDFVLRRFARRNRQDHPFSLDAQTWAAVKEMPWDAALESDVMRMLEHSYRTGSWFKRKYLHQAKRIEDPAASRAALGLDPRKKTAVIFSHVLWDATFFYGRGLFEDYETWLIETVRAACANPSLNWVVKLHPDLVWKLKYEGFTGELRDIVAVHAAVGTLPPHVVIVPPDTTLSTFSFFAIADYCITVRGTIGIEMACHGVPVITAGTGRYSGLGFTVDSESRQEYLARLSRLSEQPRMDEASITLARRFAHALFHLRPWPLRSFEVIHGTIDEVGHPLVQNIVPRVSTAEEFAAAEDVRSLCAWLDSRSADYMQPNRIGVHA